MTPIAIRVENLGKQYKIGSHQARYDTLRDSIVNAARSLITIHPRSPSNQAPDKIWALQDVSFEIGEGEVLGVIGRNGAGKSTLLKILSHITEPSRGSVRLYGRVGSLLEVGTGFQNELTGRENIYLSGAILGMRRSEIIRKFDEIVAFSEVGKFLDTPVKHYSSGMYVRLAFAVAAHLQPDILLIDEVLAVGDVAFQKKCLGKIGDVAHEGRTVIFISHNMGAIETLCQKAILLNEGRMVEMGDVHQVVSSYLGMNYVEETNPFVVCKRSGTGKVRINSFHIEDHDGNVVSYATSGSPLALVIGYEVGEDPCSAVSIGFSVHKQNEDNLFLYYSHFSDVLFSGLQGRGEFHCLLPECFLSPGNYLVMLRVLDNGIEADWPKVYLPLSVHMGDFYRTGSFDGALVSWGPIMARGEWTIRMTK
jgi:lipopolysaccharide transport system ATP-binding protein